MDTVVFDRISFDLDIDAVYAKLQIKKDGKSAARARELMDEAKTIAKPKGVYRLSFIESKGDDFIVVDGEKLESRILRVNVDKVNRVFPLIATAGIEIEEWAKGFNNILDAYIADGIAEMICLEALAAVRRDIDVKYDLENPSEMNPGSLEEWPIYEQKKLFSIMDNSNEKIGVELTNSFLMIPAKTVSGIRFSSASTFHNCQLCPNAKCPNRSAAYDSELYAARYGIKNSNA